jgi:hypothetical protein
MERRRNEGGRYSTQNGSDWYKAIEEENIRRIEAAWAARQASSEEYYPESDGDLVPWDRAA